MNVKQPLYQLWKIDKTNRKLVKERIIYNVDIVSSSDTWSSRSDNTVSLILHKFKPLLDNDYQGYDSDYEKNNEKGQYSEWNTWVLDLVDNTLSGAEMYFITSTFSLNKNENTETLTYGYTNRGGENTYSGFYPYFGGYLTNIDVSPDKDTVNFNFSGYNWAFNRKLFNPNQDVTKVGPDTWYGYCNAQGEDADGGFTIIAPTDDEQRNLGLLHMGTFVPTSDYKSGSLYNSGNSIKSKYGGRVHVLGKAKVYNTLEDSRGGEVFIRKTVTRVNSGVTELSQFVVHSANLDVAGGKYTWFKLDMTYNQTETVGRDNVTEVKYEMLINLGGDYETDANNNWGVHFSSLYVSTNGMCYNNDTLVNKNATKSSENVALLLGSQLRHIMDSCSPQYDGGLNMGNYIFDDYIMFFHDLGDFQWDWSYAGSRMKVNDANNETPNFSWDKWHTTIYTAIEQVLSTNLDSLSTWGFGINTNGKVMLDVASGVSETHLIETDYTNCDVKYDIKDNYYNHFYTHFGSGEDMPDSEEHTASHTLTDQRPKDPILMSYHNDYTGEPQSEGMTDEQMSQRLYDFNFQYAQTYRRNKLQYIYRTEEFIPDARIGDYIKSTPESPIQLKNRIISISRTFENDNSRWVYELEGEL